MTRVLHTGDTHIGYQQYNAPDRREDFLDAFRQVIDDAIADDVDAVVHAGDLFHDRRPGLVDLKGTVEVLRTLADAEIPFLAVVGNHEGKRDAQWLDLFADLGLASRLDDRPQLIDDVAFYGLDFVPRSRREDLDYAFDPVPDGADHAVLVSHGLFEPFGHADWDTDRLLTESTVDFDALLLGDNHTPGIAELEQTWVTYCGSTERASASEREARGYNLVTFDEAIDIRRRGLDTTREFVFVDCELAADEGAEQVRARVGEYDLTDAVVIVTIEGEGASIAPATIEEFAIDRGALIARVNDRRELPDEEADVSVSFADPDAAVRERVRELGLSDAALQIDETVRNGELPDSNVRETVEGRVRERLEDDRAFDPAAPVETDREEETPDGDSDEETAGEASDETETGARSEEAGDPDDDRETDERSDAPTDTASLGDFA